MRGIVVYAARCQRFFINRLPSPPTILLIIKFDGSSHNGNTGRDHVVLRSTQISCSYFQRAVCLHNRSFLVRQRLATSLKYSDLIGNLTAGIAVTMTFFSGEVDCSSLNGTRHMEVWIYNGTSQGHNKVATACDQICRRQTRPPHQNGIGICHGGISRSSRTALRETPP
eukprot:7500412-Pyramimonas_sp.AAC.1